MNTYSEPIHVLFNNAAAPLGPYSETVDGLESQFGIDHVAHTLFTHLILPRIRAGCSATFQPRIIFVSSIGHSANPAVNFENLNYDTGTTYDKWAAYATAKTANILTASEFARRLAGEGILAYSLHPGSIDTNLAKLIPVVDFIRIGALDENGNRWDKFQWKTMDEGISTHLVAAFDPSIADQSGGYLLDAQVRNDLISPWASNPVHAAKLWSITEGLVGETFTLKA